MEATDRTAEHVSFAGGRHVTTLCQALVRPDDLGWTLVVSREAVRTNLRPRRSSRALARPLQLAATWAYSSRKMGSTSTPAAHAIYVRVWG